MTPERVVSDTALSTVHKHAACVALNVGGGIESRFGVNYEVDPKKYQAALELAIAKSGIFSGICRRGEPGLKLDVVVFRATVDESGSITHQTRTVPVNWRLSDPQSNRIFYQERISGTGTNKKTLGGERIIVLSTEAAVRDSIVKGLEAISRLTIDRS